MEGLRRRRAGAERSEATAAVTMRSSHILHSISVYCIALKLTPPHPFTRRSTPLLRSSNPSLGKRSLTLGGRQKTEKLSKEHVRAHEEELRTFAPAAYRPPL